MPGLPVLGPRTPPGPTDLALYRDFQADLERFSTTLREGRCRRTNHFDARLDQTMAVFGPLFAMHTMEILFALFMRGPLRFNELKVSLEAISSRVLSDKLKLLVREGLVSRAVGGRSVSYALTPKGVRVGQHLHPLVFFLHNAPRVLVQSGASEQGSR